MRTRYAEYFPEFIEQGHRGGAARPAARRVRPEVPGRGAGCQPRPQVRLSWPADPLRPLFPARPRPAHRAAAGLLHARGDGSGAERSRSAEARAIEFYNVLSSFDFMSSTPTLFNSGTQRSQLSSCYLTTVSDDLDGIYEAIKENALLSKYAGGLGNDWTPVRALGSHIKGTNGKSQGRGAVPEGGERHRRGGEPGRQAQGRGVLLPGDLAPGHRGIPRAAQEHRRRPPPHPRHEHGQLGSGPVHEAGDGERRVDAVLALRCAGPARQVRQGVREGLPEYEGEGGERRAEAASRRSRRSSSGARC